MKILKADLKSLNKFREKFTPYTERYCQQIFQEYEIGFNEKELSEILLSVFRLNEFQVIEGKEVNWENLEHWLKDKLVPNLVILNLGDEDVVRLLIFCLEITYQMFSGGSRATISQKGFRERRRTFESILVDQFIGKLGEVFLKRYLEDKFRAEILLDWEISPQREKYQKDIINAKRNISIKSSPALAGIWAEAGLGYDYGVMVKCMVPEQPILQFFIEVCGFSRLLDFAREKISPSDQLFAGYLEDIRSRIQDYKCGEMKSELKGFICGYFSTKEYQPVRTGTRLEYLGEVREERYIIPLSQLKYQPEHWKEFLKENELAVGAS